MTNNGTGKVEKNFNNVSYDSGNRKQQVAVSATEVEFLNDIPPPYNTGNNSRDGYGAQTTSSSTIGKQQQQQQQQKQNNYQRLATNRGQERSNIVYQDENNQQLNSAVNKLLDKYAPDANPQNLSNNSNNNRRLQPHVTVLTDPPVSTFQTNSNNYSTVIRPNTGQNSQIPTQINPNNNSNNYIPNNQQSTRPVTNYDSFQHVIPQTQQQQQQTHPSVSVKTKNGNVAQVVPGKLYPLDNDPLSILYDKQNTTFTTQQRPITTSTFQPSTTYKTTATTFDDPLSIFYTGTSQKYPQQPMAPPSSTNTTTNANATEPFDLGNLIKRVQQDYLREIQPFVTSVQFVEKDREFGQNLSDVDFTTPVTVGKGFAKQADDILQRSFGRPNPLQRPPANNGYPDNQYASNHHTTIDAKQSYSSYTSSNESDDDESYPAGNNSNQKVEMRNQATVTSPSLRVNRTRPLNQLQNTRGPSVDVPLGSTTNYRSVGTEKPTTSSVKHAVPKRAQRVPTDELSEASSSESSASDDERKYSATYNEHEQPSGTLQAMVRTAPALKPINETVSERTNTVNPAVQRSEDIHPVPPTTTPTYPNARTAVRKAESVSESIASGSDDVSDSDIDDQSAAYNEHIPASTTARSNIQPVTSSVPTGRDAVAATGRDVVAATGRDTVAATGRDAVAATGRDAVAATGRDAAGAGAPTARDAAGAGAPTARDAAGAGAPTARDAAGAGAPTARDAAATQPNARVTTAPNPPPNARDAVASGANPNQRNPPPNDRGAQAIATVQPVSTAGKAPTGSNRFYQGDEQKSSAKRSIKDTPAAIGNKIKSIFHRKK